MFRKISVQQLTLGMHLHAFCGSWLEHPFWRTHFVISDPKDLELIRDSNIREVWIDISQGLDIPPDTNPGTEAPAALAEIPPAPPVESEKLGLQDELKRAAKIVTKGRRAVIAMFQEARLGQAIDLSAAEPLVEEIYHSIQRNSDALISLARLKLADDYTYMHSVAVCALMIALARQLELDDAQTRAAGRAGLLHDLGKALIPLEILNKPGKLTEAEFTLVKTHPSAGYKLLREASSVDDAIIDACLHHHEKIDGSGYPQGLHDEELTLLAKMSAVCDVYDAITSNRPYKAGWEPAESIKRMAEWKGHFDPVVFKAFVRSVGIYPTGSFVKLESGRLGVVIEQGEKSLLAPKVRVFFSAKIPGYIKPEVLDLGRSTLRDRILGHEDPKKWGIKNLEQYWKD